MEQNLNTRRNRKRDGIGIGKESEKWMDRIGAMLKEGALRWNSRRRRRRRKIHIKNKGKNTSEDIRKHRFKNTTFVLKKTTSIGFYRIFNWK